MKTSLEQLASYGFYSKGLESKDHIIFSRAFARVAENISSTTPGLVNLVEALCSSKSAGAVRSQPLPHGLVQARVDATELLFKAILAARFPHPREALLKHLEPCVLSLGKENEEAYEQLLAASLKGFGLTIGPTMLGLLIMLCKLNPEKMPYMVERLLNDALIYAPSAFVLPNMETMASAMEAQIRSHPELADRLFEEMKANAEKRGVYPWKLLSVFGDKAKTYFLGAYASAEDSTRTEIVAERLSHFHDPDVLELALKHFSPDDISRYEGLFEKFKHDPPVQAKLAGLLPARYSETNRWVLTVLASAGAHHLAEDILKKFDAILAKSVKEEGSDWQFDKMNRRSRLCTRVVLICGEKARGKLLKLSKSPKAEIRGPAFEALGILGEAELLKSALETDRSKWSKFFIALGMVRCGNEDAIGPGLSYIGMHLSRIGRGGSFEAALAYLFDETMNQALPAYIEQANMRPILKFFGAPTRIRQHAVKALNDHIEACGSVAQLDKLKAQIIEAVEHADQDAPRYKQTKHEAAKIVGAIYARRNKLLAVEVNIDADIVLKRPKLPKRSRGMYRMPAVVT